MKGHVVAHGQHLGRTAAAWIKDGQLEDFILDPPEQVPRVGTVFRAVAERRAKSVGGQFVRLPLGTGFLRGATVPEGTPVLVQISGYADPGKAPPMTARIRLKGRYAIATPGAPGINVSRKIASEERRADLVALVQRTAPDLQGVVLRSAAATAADDVVVEELRALDAASARTTHVQQTPERLLDGPSAQEIAARDWPRVAPIGFEDADVASYLAGMLSATHPLARGALTVERTRALTAVDVDTKGDFSPAAGAKANLAMAQALPRILRCRGVGGQVVIDPAPMPKRARTEVEATLARAFANEEIETTLLGWTALGHLELRRQRTRYPL